MIENKYPHVLQPLKIRGVTLKSRLAYAPTVVLKCSPKGEVVQEMLDYVSWQARTGVAYMTVGNTPVVHEDSSAWLCELDVTSDECLHGMAQMVNAARDNGAEISVELAHAGRGSHVTPGHPALAPSAKPLPGHDASDLKEMDRADMDFVRDQFVDCAVRCKKAGMKIVMIHCAHQNLLAQFISPDCNIRTDEYGGSLENRMRYPLEVLKAVREAVGDDMVVELRVSAQEDTPGGLELEESIQFMKQAQKYVDIMHVSRGNIHGHAQYTIPTLFRGRLLNVAYAERVKKEIDIPVAVVGNITSLREAEDIISSGKADIVVMAKAYMADERLVEKSLDGRVDEIRPCTRCDKCGWHNIYGLSMRCAINPRLGLEYELKKPEKKKRVMVVGGGPGGMMAAQTLAELGHDVTLYEKSGSLGGLLLDATQAKFKEYLRLYTQWDIRMTQRCGAKIVLNTEVTPEFVAKKNPDAVIVATGSEYIVPEIPGMGLPNVHMFREVEHHRVSVGEKVVICGGGQVGLECALALAEEQGKKVTVVDMFPAEHYPTVMFGFNGAELYEKLIAAGVELVGGSRVVRFEEDCVVTVDSEGHEKRFFGDDFVIAMGVRPNNALGEKLLSMYPRDVYVVGDCMGKNRTIYEANQEAFHAAISIK